MLTDAYLYESSVRIEIELFANHMTRLQQHADCLPSGDYDLVLELTPTEDGTNEWCYYFVDHSMRTLFWLEDFDATELVSELTSISSDNPKFSISQSYFFSLMCLPH